MCLVIVPSDFVLTHDGDGAVESNTFLLPFLFAARFHTLGSLFQGNRFSCCLGLAVFGGGDLSSSFAPFHACLASGGDHSLLSVSLTQRSLEPLS